jgi:thioredoxin 1
MHTEISNQLLLSSDNFKATIEAHPFVIVDFWAEWCAPCMDFMPVFDQVAAEHPHIIFAKVHVDTSADVATYFNVKKIPAILVIRDRVVIDAVEGMMKVHELNHHIQMWSVFDMTQINAHFDAKEAAA